MASRSNLNTDEIYRYRADGTGEVWVDIWKDGTPDPTARNRAWAFEFVARATESQITSMLTLSGGEVLRVADKPQRIGIWLSPENRVRLRDSSYRLWVHEVVGGRNEPKVVYTYNWQGEPVPFQDGLPMEPAILVLNILTQAETSSVTTVLEGPRGRDALTVLPVGTTLAQVVADTPQLVLVSALNDEQLVVKIGNQLFGVPLVKLS